MVPYEVQIHGAVNTMGRKTDMRGQCYGDEMTARPHTGGTVHDDNDMIYLTLILLMWRIR
jgi:hypothetical protein